MGGNGMMMRRKMQKPGKETTKVTTRKHGLKKVLVAGTVSLSMMAGMLVGCGGKTQDQAGEGTDNQSQAAAVETAKEADSSTGNAAENTAAGADNGDKVVIQYFAWSEGDYLNQIVDAYNAQSSVCEVKMTQVNSSDYDDKLMTMLAGKNDIDVFNMRSGSLLTSLAESGNLADISALIEQSGLDLSIYGTGFADTKVKDSFYALPYRASAFGLFYNKKIFDEKKIPYPEDLTWEEYGDLALKLSEGEGSKRFYGGYIPDWSSCPYKVLQSGSNLIDDDLAPIKDWMSLMNRFYNTDNSHMSYTDMKSTGTDGINFFCNSGCAMYPGGEWSISDVLTMLKNNPQLNETFELGIATVPQPKKGGDKITIGGVSTFAGINASSEKQEAAYDFIQYLSGKEAAMVIAGSGAIPAYIDADVTKAFETAVGVDGASNILNVNKVTENLFIPVYTDVTGVYMEEMELYLIGSQSLDDAVKNFEDRRAELIPQ